MESKSLEEKLPFEIHHIPIALTYTFIRYSQGFSEMILGGTRAVFTESLKNLGLIDRNIEY